MRFRPKDGKKSSFTMSTKGKITPAKRSSGRTFVILTIHHDLLYKHFLASKNYGLAPKLFVFPFTRGRTIKLLEENVTRYFEELVDEDEDERVVLFDEYRVESMPCIASADSLLLGLVTLANSNGEVCFLDIF